MSNLQNAAGEAACRFLKQILRMWMQCKHRLTVKWDSIGVRIGLAHLTANQAPAQSKAIILLQIDVSNLSNVHCCTIEPCKVANTAWAYATYRTWCVCLKNRTLLFSARLGRRADALFKALEAGCRL